MASSKNMDVDEAPEKLPNMWHSQLLRTPLEDPLYCCYSIWCSCCAAYGLRGRVLDNDWSRYQCCGGSMPCSGSWGEEKCPRLCAVLEVIMCFTLAVFVTRSMLQDALQTKNAKCDNCIIANIYHCTPFCTCCLACRQYSTSWSSTREMVRSILVRLGPLPSKKCPGTELAN